MEELGRHPTGAYVHFLGKTEQAHWKLEKNNIIVKSYQVLGLEGPCLEIVHS